MEEFLRYVIGALVEFPDELVITRTDSPGRVTFHVAMRHSDLPRAIGKGGSTVEALRSLLHAAAQKRGTKAYLELVE